MTDTSDSLKWLAHPEAFDALPIAADEVPELYRSLASLDTSMTVAIKQRLGSDAKVLVHYADSLALCSFEIDQLQTETGFARQISLQVNNERVLAARSIVSPVSELQLLLSRGNTKPLGELLFTDDRWRRLSEPVPLKTSDGLFGRYCRWQDAQTGDILIVEEFFLPALVRN